MVSPVKIPIPQSGIMLDPKTGRPTREWYIFWENLGTIVNPLSLLPNDKIWIGNAANSPVAYPVSGDVLLSNVGVATLQETPNVTLIVESIISDSGAGILANDIFGKRSMQAPVEQSAVVVDFSSDQNILANQIFGY